MSKNNNMKFKRKESLYECCINEEEKEPIAFS